jgi:aspartyl-tRNA(Asn)/glutamyl-tRNA(Gln) amidotransferase subunit C
MLTQINGFFDIVEAMRAVDTTGIEPLRTPWRRCRTCSCACATTSPASPMQREANQRSAPAVEGGLFLVPKVIE